MLENVYAVRVLILLLLLLLAFLVAAFLASERRTQLLPRLRRVQF